MGGLALGALVVGLYIAGSTGFGPVSVETSLLGGGYGVAQLTRRPLDSVNGA
jgi:hypothetical protein